MVSGLQDMTGAIQGTKKQYQTKQKNNKKICLIQDIFSYQVPEAGKDITKERKRKTCLTLAFGCHVNDGSSFQHCQKLKHENS